MVSAGATTPNTETLSDSPPRREKNIVLCGTRGVVIHVSLHGRYISSRIIVKWEESASILLQIKLKRIYLEVPKGSATTTACSQPEETAPYNNASNYGTMQGITRYYKHHMWTIFTSVWSVAQFAHDSVS